MYSWSTPAHKKPRKGFCFAGLDSPLALLCSKPTLALRELRPRSESNPACYTYFHMKNSLYKKGFALVVIAVIIAVVVGGGYLAVKKLKVHSVTSEIQSPETVGWKTYTNTKYGFKMEYPAGYSLTDTDVPPSYPHPRLVKFSATEEYLDDTSISIFADNTPAHLSTCLKTYDGRGLTRTKEINGNKFYVVSDKEGDAAMGGQRGQISEYHLVRNNNCYVIDAHVYWHIVGYGGYINTGVNDATPEQTHAQQEAIAKHTNVLDSILATFKFVSDGKR